MAIESEPHNRLLDRHTDRIENKEYLEELDGAFTALLNEATWLFSRMWERNAGDLTAEVVLLLLRHMIEMTDGVHVLLLTSASRPAQLQLRSMFEAMLYMEFILQDDSERRARAYEVGSRMWSYRYAKRMERGSQARIQFIKEVGTDPLVTPEMIEGWVTDPEQLAAAEAQLRGTARRRSEALRQEGPTMVHRPGREAQRPPSARHSPQEGCSVHPPRQLVAGGASGHDRSTASGHRRGRNDHGADASGRRALERRCRSGWPDAAAGSRDGIGAIPAGGASDVQDEGSAGDHSEVRPPRGHSDATSAASGWPR